MSTNGIKISELPPLATLTDDSLFAVVEGGVTKNITGELVREFALSNAPVRATWTDYVTRWDAEPVSLGPATAPVAGEVFEYTLEGVTRFRLVPEPYAPADDVFYESFASGTCSTAIVSRNYL
jgi:hypothetical protein